MCFSAARNGIDLINTAKMLIEQGDTDGAQNLLTDVEQHTNLDLRHDGETLRVHLERAKRTLARSNETSVPTDFVDPF